MRPRIGIQFGEGADAAKLAKTLGAQITLAPMWWGVVESRPGVYDWARVRHWERLRSEGVDPLKVWTLYVLHMNERGELPPDLQGVPLDSDEFLRRFDAFIQEAADQAGWDAERGIVLVCNEVDVWAESHSAELEAGWRFMEHAVHSIKSVAPNARVTHSVTYDILGKPGGREFAERLFDGCDVVAFTWYDLEDLLVRGADMRKVLDDMIEFAGGRPVIFKEIALPSGAATGSSEQRQARRVAEMFEVLSECDGESVIGAVWLTTDDWPKQPMREYIKKQFPVFDGNEAFFDFLTSMGLRRDDGSHKPAWDVWIDKMGIYAC